MTNDLTHTQTNWRNLIWFCLLNSGIGHAVYWPAASFIDPSLAALWAITIMIMSGISAFCLANSWHQ
jgi:hypothetical protein